MSTYCLYIYTCKCQEKKCFIKLYKIFQQILHFAGIPLFLSEIYETIIIKNLFIYDISLFSVVISHS